MGPVGRILILLVAVAGVLSACGPLDKSQWVTGHVSGNKTFALTVIYGGNSTGIGMSTYADVPDGTAGTLELTGTQHWRCQGQFRNHQAERGTFPWDMENLPGFTPPGSTDPVVNFFPPRGSYTLTVRIPSLGAELKKSLTLDPGGGSDPQTGLYQHDRGCVLVADTAAQQRSLIAQYLDAMHLRVKEYGKPDLREMIARAEQQFASASQTTEPAVIQSRYHEMVGTLTEFKDALLVDFPDLPPGLVIWATEDAIALLSQSGLP